MSCGFSQLLHVVAFATADIEQRLVKTYRAFFDALGNGVSQVVIVTCAQKTLTAADHLITVNWLATAFVLHHKQVEITLFCAIETVII